LKTFGFIVSNDTFAENSWYFRNALVRANYNNLKQKITSTTEYLEPFFENLLLDTHHELKNRFLHVGFQSASQGANKSAPKCNICTLEELAILKALDGDPSITQKQLAEKIGKSERTVKTRTVEMQEKGLIRRLNGKRNGTWEILIEINE
jgi:DNA-binding MarR family transcriptional regulator